MIWQIQVITFTEERINAGRGVLSAVEHLRLRKDSHGNQRKAGKTKADARHTAHWQLPHDGKGAFFMVFGKDQREAVHALQI